MKRRLAAQSVLAAALVATLGCGANDGGVVVESAGGDVSASCGNDVVDEGEECDGTDDCTSECLVNVCGDGFLGAGEQCDDANGEDADSCTAQCELGPQAVLDIAMGEYHVCAVSLSGAVKCWGASDYGRLGQPGYDENIGDDEAPSDWDDVEVASGVVELVAGSDHTCALLDSGRVACWGYNNGRQLGYDHNDNVGDDETPASAGDVGLAGVIGLAAGDTHTCALLSGGDVTCWGQGASALGYGDSMSSMDGDTAGSLGLVSLQGPAAEITAGNSHTCARLESGEVTCWGANESGQLGTGQPDAIGDDEVPSSIPTIDLGGTAVDIDAGWHTTCAALSDGSARCWGSNSSGQLGNGGTEDVGDRKTPAEEGVVLFDGEAIGVEVGKSHACAITAAGSVHCWGTGQYLGYEDYESRAQPGRAVALGVGATALEIGAETSCAVTKSAGVRCWGGNVGGVLGQPEAGGYSSTSDPATHGDIDIF